MWAYRTAAVCRRRLLLQMNIKPQGGISITLRLNCRVKPFIINFLMSLFFPFILTELRTKCMQVNGRKSNKMTELLKELMRDEI